MKRRRESGNGLFCDLCQVRLSSESLFATHAAGKRHQENEKRKREREETAKQSVYIRNFPPETAEKEIKAAFAKFGEIRKVVMVQDKRGSYALVEFSSAESALSSLQQPVLIGDKKATVKPRNVKDHSTTFPDPLEPETKRAKSGARRGMKEIEGVRAFPEDVLERVKFAGSVTGQAEALLSGLGLTETGVAERFRACADFQSAISQAYPHCIVIPYGSSSNQLGAVGCDMDVTVLLQRRPIDSIAMYRKAIPSAEVSASCEDVESLDEALDRCAACLSSGVPGLKIIKIIRVTKCPVITFTYKDINCDMSINNRLALENTSLLSAYMQFGDWVCLFLFVLRCWGYVRGFSGFHSPGSLSSYALSLMAIHYLQQSGEFPCLSQNDTLTMQKVEIDGWDCTFSDPKMSPIDSKQPDLGPLLVGFWNYFSSFDFSTRVCCIHTTAIPEKSSLSEETFITQPLPLVCVQDPFEHSHITTRSVTPHTLQRFIHDSQSAVYILSHAGGLADVLHPPSLKHKIIHVPASGKFASVNLAGILQYVCQGLQEQLDFSIRSLSEENDVVPRPGSQSVEEIAESQEACMRRVEGKQQRVCIGAHCFVKSRTWVGRRHVKRMGGQGSSDDSGQHLLRFNVLVSEFSPDPERCGFDIRFMPVYSPVESDFQLCFAFYKKWLLESLIQ
eukprot:m.24277 g.24277  ORF g.24277 m.24277 type:complete len:675 (+) comp28587_c0_seq2:29-2053(+)